eukprot:jgi/Botrbrau1/18326/Bobra.0179s0054.2
MRECGGFQDLWLRGMVLLLEPQFKQVAVVGPNNLNWYQRDYAPYLVKWLAWADSACEYLLQSLRFYLKLKLEAGTDDQKHALADNVPCARLLSDLQAMNALNTILTIGSLMEKSNRRTALLATLKRLETVKHQALKYNIKQLDQKTLDTPGASLEITNGILSSFMGNFSLHYSRNQGPVEWRVLGWFFSAGTDQNCLVFDQTTPLPPDMQGKIRQAITVFEDLRLPEPTLESLRQDAAKLGLRRGLPTPSPLPVQASTPPNCPQTPPLLEEARGSRGRVEEGAPLPADDTGPLLRNCVSSEEGSDHHRNKRRRWTAERDAAMGLSSSNEAEKGVGTVDILAGARLVPHLPPTHVSVDGLCYTADLAPVAAPDMAGMSRLLRRAYMDVCPITMSYWRRVRSAASS